MLKLLIFLLSTLSPSLLFFPSLTLCFSFHYRCTRWIQWDYLCLWSNLLWKNTHHGGTVQLNNSKGFLPRRTHMNTHICFFFLYLLPSSPWQYISLHHCHRSLSRPNSLLWPLTSFTTLSGKQPCSFSSQKPRSSSSFYYPLCLILPRVSIYPSLASLSCSYLVFFFLLVGEPSRPPGNGNHPPDLRRHFRTHIRHGREPRIPHQGWWECSSLNTHYETFSGNWARAVWCNPHMDGLSGVSQASINHDIQTMLILQYLLCSFCSYTTVF